MGKKMEIDKNLLKEVEALVKDIEISKIFEINHGGRSKPLTHSSRKEELRSATITVCHKPTQRNLVVEIPKGHYTKAQMQELRKKAIAELALKIALGKL